MWRLHMDRGNAGRQNSSVETINTHTKTINGRINASACKKD